MPRSPNTFCPPSRRRPVPVVALVVDGIDWHARTLDKGVRRTRRARRFRSSLQACGIETQGVIRAQHRRAGRPSSRRRVRALDVRRHVPGGDAAPRHSPRVARERRPGLERCARDRTLRRQIDDQLSAGARGHSDSRHVGGRIAGSRAGDRAARERARAAGAQAAVRLAGARPEADPERRTICPPRTRSPASIICSATSASRAATASAISACSSRADASSPPWRGTRPAGSPT